MIREQLKLNSRTILETFCSSQNIYIVYTRLHRKPEIDKGLQDWAIQKTVPIVIMEKDKKKCHLTYTQTPF